MSKLLQLSLKSRIQKALRTVRKLLCYSILGLFYLLAYLYGFFAILVIFFSLLWSFYSVLWIGEPIAITCHNMDFIRVDCTVKHRALIRESEQQIRDVQSLKVETRVLTSDSGRETRYRASLTSQSGDRFVKEYSNENDPEIQDLQRRLNRFIENPEERLTFRLRYNLWNPIFTFLFLLPFVLCIFACVLYLAIRSVQWVLIALQKTLKAINI